MDSVSTVQLKVSNLEMVVDKMAQELVHGGRYSDALGAKLLKRSPSIASPRLSTCTPRTSVDSSKHSTLLPTKHAGVWEDTFTRSRTNNTGRPNSDMWADATLKPSKVFLGKATPASICTEIHEEPMRKNVVYDPKVRLNKLEAKNSPWKVVKDYFCNGDLDSAYAEALSSRNEQLLFELLDRTGPSLENLSKKTANDLLSNLASYLMDQRFASSIIPWLQQASYFGFYLHSIVHIPYFSLQLIIMSSKNNTFSVFISSWTLVTSMDQPTWRYPQKQSKNSYMESRRLPNRTFLILRREDALLK